MNPADIVRHVAKYVPEVREPKFRIDGDAGHFICTIDGKMIVTHVDLSFGMYTHAVGNAIVYELRQRVGVKA